MKIGNVFTRIAESKVGEKFFKKLSNPENQASVTNALLTVDTLASTASYMYFTQKQDKIDKESKFAMQVQHVLSALLSVLICTPINKKVGVLAKEIGKRIDPKIVDPHKVIAGIGILGPTAVISIMNRCTLPAILTPVSSVIRDHLKEKHSNKLDIQA